MKIKDNMLKLDLQFFADEENGAEDQGAEESSGGEKKFTQSEMDKILNDRLARERKLLEKKYSNREQPADENESEKDSGNNSGDNTDQNKLDEALGKLNKVLELNESLTGTVKDLQKENKRKDLISQGYSEENANRLISMDGAVDEETFKIVADSLKQSDTALRVKSSSTIAANKKQEIESNHDKLMEELGYLDR